MASRQAPILTWMAFAGFPFLRWLVCFFLGPHAQARVCAFWVSESTGEAARGLGRLRIESWAEGSWAVPLVLGCVGLPRPAACRMLLQNGMLLP